MAEARDKTGAVRHVTGLVSKALMGAKLSEEVLEAMTGLGILQPGATLVPDLPSIIIRETHASLDRKAKPHALVIFLSAALHSAPHWLQQHWGESAELMSRCIAEGEVLSVMRGLDVVLSCA